MFSVWLIDLGSGLLSACDPAVFLAALLGVFIGTGFGFIPGLGPNIAIAVAIPVTYSLSPLIAISFLLGIYKGGIYGGSISAILINTPGTAASTATLLDGYPMAQQGKAVKALKCALYGSIIGDAFAIFLLIIIAQPIASIAMKFGPVELFSLLVFALTVVGTLAAGNISKGFISICFGLMLGTVGIDPITGDPRFTFGTTYLQDGLPLIAMCIGLFALVEVLMQAQEKTVNNKKSLLPISTCKEDNYMTKKDWKLCLPVYLQSSVIGAIIGVLPGTGSTMGAYLSYGNAQRRSKSPDLFGKGNIEGVAASEAGNNAVCGGALIPMLTLGVPGDGVTAILMSALLLHGVVVGPMIFMDYRAFTFGIFGMLLVSIFMLFFCGHFYIWLGKKISNIPQALIMPIVVMLCVMGTYATSYNLIDIGLMCGFALLGYILIKAKIPVAPLLIAFVLAPSIETHYRRAMLLSQGDYTTFVSSPISLLFLILALITVIQVARSALKKK